MVYITAENVRSNFNSTFDSTTTNYTFWGQSFSSGSIISIITNSENYIKFLITASTYNTTDTDTLNAVKDLCLNYTCFRLGVILAGGVVTGGFDYSIGPMTVDKTQGQIAFYRSLIDGFRETAMATLYIIQPLSILEESSTPTWSETSPSIM